MDMYTSFSADLEEATKEEAMASREFEQLYYDLEQKKLSLEEALAMEEEHLAVTEEQLASDLQLHDDTDLEIKQNIAFYDAMNKSCVEKFEEWTLRSKARTA